MRRDVAARNEDDLVGTAHPGRRRLLPARLKERGLTTEDIDYVFLTHAHWDHMLNVDLFPNAQIIIHPRERAYIKQPAEGDWATLRYATTILESMRLQEVKEGEEIDDGVFVTETPGHSPGSMALLVRGPNGTAAISGDALPNTWSVTSGMPRHVFSNVGDAKASIRKLLDGAQSFYPSHDRAFRIDGGKFTYLEPTSINVFGWPDPGDGEGPSGIGHVTEPPRQSDVWV